MDDTPFDENSFVFTYPVFSCWIQKHHVFRFPPAHGNGRLRHPRLHDEHARMTTSRRTPSRRASSSTQPEPGHLCREAEDPR